MKKLHNPFHNVNVTADPASVAKGLLKAPAATHMLLYLNDKSFVGDPGEALADELRQLRWGGGASTSRASSRVTGASKGVPIVLVHENDPARGGCEFGTFFQTVRDTVTAV